MALPTGPAVTFLFTDIEGSTRLERAVGSVAWATLVARHDVVLRAAIEGAGGVVVKTEGDAFFAAFATPGAAVAAAVAAQRAIAAEPWPGAGPIRVRMGLHLGEGRLRSGRAEHDPEDYVGIDVNYTARIAAAGNGGQIVLSRALVAALGADALDTTGIGEVTLVEDGPRTVKDFEDPLPLYRLVVPGAADDERRLRTLDVPTNLPGEVTALVGREEQVATLVAELGRGRIVTLTGPGGSGKTRLALATARDLRDRFPHGVWFVDLAAVREPALLEPAIAATLGVRESPDRTAAEALVAHLRGRTTLLVLDNMEQLLPDGASIVARLVRDAPELRVLITSRELLRISGEHGHPVPPLAVDDGIALFLDRARALRPDLAFTDDALAAVQAICERLDGLPLGIELAAARVRVMSPDAILDRLARSLDLGGGARDLPERQRTLRGTVAWSHDLLTGPERRLFARLAAFSDGWTAETAFPVADPDGDLGIDVADGLESLVDKSLIRVDAGGGEPRFGLHPLLHEYALERLGESGERHAVEERVARVLVALAEAIGPSILGQGAEATLRWLDAEARNLAAVTAWAIDEDETDLGLRLFAATWRWLQQRGRIREPRAALARLLAAEPHGDIRHRIGGLAAEGGLAYWMRDFAAARAAYEERLALALTTGDAVLIADGHYDLGFMGMVEQDVGFLREHEEAALAGYLGAGLEGPTVRARQALVLAVFLVGDYDRAQALESENLEVFRRLESPHEIADCMTLLSAIHWRKGDVTTAWALVTEGLERFATVESMTGIARALAMTAIIQLADADPELGARIAGATYRLARDKGVMLAPVEVLHLPDPGGLAVERLGAERATALQDDGAAVPLETLIAEVIVAPGPRPAVAPPAPPRGA